MDLGSAFWGHEGAAPIARGGTSGFTGARRGERDSLPLFPHPLALTEALQVLVVAKRNTFKTPNSPNPAAFLAPSSSSCFLGCPFGAVPGLAPVSEWQPRGLPAAPDSFLYAWPPSWACSIIQAASWQSSLVPVIPAKCSAEPENDRGCSALKKNTLKIQEFGLQIPFLLPNLDNRAQAGAQPLILAPRRLHEVMLQIFFLIFQKKKKKKSFAKLFSFFFFPRLVLFFAPALTTADAAASK